MVKRTFQPNNRKKHKKHGFLVRSKDPKARLILKRRRARGRAKIAV